MARVVTLAVVGAGTLGRQVAHQAAVAGYHLILVDVLPSALRNAEREIQTNLDNTVKLGMVSLTEARAAIERMEYAENIEEAARDADMVIEMLPEELESKIEVFTLLDKICRPGTILASNTLSLSVAEISSVTFRAEKCIGIRFVHPVHRMKTLEIVRTPQTDEATVAAAVEIGRSMKKETAVILEALPDLSLSGGNIVLRN